MGEDVSLADSLRELTSKEFLFQPQLSKMMGKEAVQMIDLKSSWEV